MQIKSINYINFRNLKNNKLEFHPRFNLFMGKNGQGKTSILEAIYFSITGKSFRTKHIKELIKYDYQDAGAMINYEDRLGKKSIGIKFNGKTREYLYNKSKVKFDEFIGRVNVISFIPDDIYLILGNPSLRRTFFDYEIAQGNEIYYKNLKDFNKILKIRNKFLKEGKRKDPLFEVYNEKFIELSVKIFSKRFEYIKKLSVLLNLNYRKLFSDKSELKIVYKSFSENIFKSEDIMKEEFIKTLDKIEKQEKYRGVSLVGPQKDDFIFYLNDKEAKAYTSQGEKKSIIFSLKVAEIDMLIKEKGEYPIFLIDDISSYFDSVRKESIINYFKGRDVQLFLSSTDDLGIESKNFNIYEGDIIEPRDS